MTERPVEDSVADVVSDILVIELRTRVNRNFDSAQKVSTLHKYSLLLLIFPF